MKPSRLFLLPGIFLAAWGMVGLFLSVSAADIKTPIAGADLTASTLFAPGKTQLDHPIPYTLTLVNLGEPLSGTVMNDVLPYGTALEPGSLQCTEGICWFDAQTNAIRWEGDLVASPFPKTRYFFTTLDNTNTIYMAEFLREGWFMTGTWHTVGQFTVPEITDTIGIDYDAEHGVLYHSDYTSNQIVVTDVNGNFLAQFTCPSASGFNSGITYLEGSAPPEVWVTDFLSNQTTRCEAPGIFPPAAPQRVGDEIGDVLEVFTNTWNQSAFGLVYNPAEGFVRYVHEELGDHSATLWDIGPITHTVLFSTSLSDLNPNWSYLWNKRNGVEWNPSTNTYFMPDYNGSLTLDDNVIEVNADGIILNAWELDGASNDSYDGSVINKVVDLALVPVHPVTITFALRVVAAPTDLLTNVVSISHTTFTTPALLTATTEIAEELYYFGDFENTDGNFSASAGSDWQWGIPSPNFLDGPDQAHSGLKVWGTALLGAVNDAPLTHTVSVSLTLPDSPTNLYIQWWDWYGTDGDDSRRILINHTELWTDPSGASQPEWQHHSVDLSAWAGQQITLEFQLHTCCTNPGPPGWYLDDIGLHTQLLPPHLAVSDVPVEVHVVQNADKTGFFDIQNTGSLGLQWTLTQWPMTTTDTLPWITALTPSSGIVGKNSTQPIGITFDATGLPTGVYTGTLMLTTNDENTPAYPVLVNMTVTEPVIYLPLVQRP